jgi:intracellular sulfur oxidation DsrE/DsrF family protein
MQSSEERKEIKVNDWVTLKYDGVTYYVCMRTLLKAYIKQKMEKEDEDH